MSKTKPLCCDECGQDNIQFQVWADENNVVKDCGLDNTMCWCEDCECETKTNLKKGDANETKTS